MSHLITAHLRSRRAKSGYQQQPITDLQYAIGGSAHEIYELLGATNYNGGVNGINKGRFVSRSKIKKALDVFCRQYVEGEAVILELAFFSTILKNWENGMRSIYIHFS